MPFPPLITNAALNPEPGKPEFPALWLFAFNRVPETFPVICILLSAADYTEGMKMERWVPIFEIFMNSSCPEVEASQWLQQSFNPSSDLHVSTSTFLSLLSTPSDVLLMNSSSPTSSHPHKRSFMYMQTLPNMVQARILSFLIYEHTKFCPKDLIKLARCILRGAEGLDFWVKKVALQLLDVLSASEYDWVSSLNLDSEDAKIDNEFRTLPGWLKDAKNGGLVLPWLPVSLDELTTQMPSNSFGKGEDSMNVYSAEEEKDENVDEMTNNVENDESEDPIGLEMEKMVDSLRERLLNFESIPKTMCLANEIRRICEESKVNSLAVLTLIAPWKAADETCSFLISQFLDRTEDELGWPSHVLCSFVLPKMLALKDPAPRMLVGAIVDYCKVHQKAAEYALLMPLILKVEGINNPICDVISRITKECLHPAHVSALCQKLLSGKVDSKKFICLPVHGCLIDRELIWTESLFTWMQNVLNHNVHLVQDSVDQLVYEVCKSASVFPRSLKFGNFLLCFVSKCAPLLKSHKLQLTEAVERTTTLLKKSIHAKLAAL